MCGHCTGRVQKALEEIPGVEGVTMSLENKSAGAGGRRILDDLEKFCISLIFDHKVKHQIPQMAVLSSRNSVVVFSDEPDPACLEALRECGNIFVDRGPADKEL